LAAIRELDAASFERLADRVDSSRFQRIVEDAVGNVNACAAAERPTMTEQDGLERRTRLVRLAYRVIGGMDLPPPDLSDKDILLAVASEALKKGVI
jgi:hypothetical protein